MVLGSVPTWRCMAVEPYWTLTREFHTRETRLLKGLASGGFEQRTIGRLDIATELHPKTHFPVKSEQDVLPIVIEHQG